MAIPTTNLVAFYNLENANDDYVNGYNLTNNNTATFTSAKIINGGTFVKTSSQYLSRSYTADLNIGGGDFTVAGWAKRSSDVYMDVMGMGWDEVTANLLYAINMRDSGQGVSPNRFSFQWHDGSYRILQDNAVTITNNVWYFFCVRRSGTTISLSVNNNTPVTTTGTLKTTTAGTFCIGRTGGGSGGYMNGQADAIGIWKGYALSDAEVTELYNSGTGQQYPFAGSFNAYPLLHHMQMAGGLM